MNNNDMVYKPCKACGSLEYDNADYREMTETPDGKFIVEPDKCDRCDFELVLSPSDLIH